MDIVNKNVVTLDSKNLELRVLESGNIEIIGKIYYNSNSEVMFDKKRKAFFVESIRPKAFSHCIEIQKEVPALIYNHDWKLKNKLVNFNYDDTEEYFKFIYVVEPSEYLLSSIDKIKDFSFGFYAKLDHWEKVQKQRYNYKRTIHSFDLVSEFSLLIGKEPCYPSAKIYFSDEEMKKEELNLFLAEAKAFIAMQKQKELQELKDYLTKKKRY